MNRKIILSLLAVFIVAISLSAVSAADDVAVDDVTTDAGIEEVAATDDVVLTDGEEKTGDDIQTLIDDAEDGGEVDLGVDQVYNVADGKTFKCLEKPYAVDDNRKKAIKKASNANLEYKKYYGFFPSNLYYYRKKIKAGEMTVGEIPNKYKTAWSDWKNGRKPWREK